MSRTVEERNQLLGMITIGFAVLQVILFLFAVSAFFMGAAGIFASPTQNYPKIYEVLMMIGMLYGALSPVLFILSLIAGLSLKLERRWIRVLTIIMSAIALLEIPFGTIYAVYALRFLLGAEGKQLYAVKYVAPSPAL